MREWMLVGALLSAPCLLSACATSSTVSAAPTDQGLSRDFAAPYDAAKAAALEAVQRMNVKVQGSDENADRFQIKFSKPISAFSWGEVGVVNVTRTVNATTRIYVNTAKRDQMQITGTSEKQFAEQIFKNIDESLKRVQP